MKILCINSGSFGSSYNIATTILSYAKNQGDDVEMVVPLPPKNPASIKIISLQNKYSRLLAKLKIKILGKDGFSINAATKKLINEIISFKPNIVHIHTVHGYFINLSLLFDYLKTTNIKIVITMHDCWYFTGRCSHFAPTNCDKWKNGCHNCKYKKIYPKEYLMDNSKNMWLKKKKLFSNKNITFIAVSNWLMNEAKNGKILEQATIKVIHNGINLPSSKKNVATKTGKIKILGVAYPWNKNKGIDVFNKLAEDLDSNKYEITLVGLTDNVATHANIKRIGIIKDKKNMLNLFLNADIFLSPSYADTFPTTNLEAISCGTPVFAFDNTGNSEIINQKCGIKIKQNNYLNLLDEILKFQRNKFNSNEIIKYSKRFSIEIMQKKYYKLYKDLIN